MQPTQKEDAMHEQRIRRFADRLETQKISDLIRQGWASQIEANRVSVVSGRKFTKVDVGDSGLFMVDREGNIFGIKSYGVVNRSRRYGTLDQPTCFA